MYTTKQMAIAPWMAQDCLGCADCREEKRKRAEREGREEKRRYLGGGEGDEVGVAGKGKGDHSKDIEIAKRKGGQHHGILRRGSDAH
jgi:hypothetical protein